jgi:cellulose synthase (UDP-forming)
VQASGPHAPLGTLLAKLLFGSGHLDLVDVSRANPFPREAGMTHDNTGAAVTDSAIESAAPREQRGFIDIKEMPPWHEQLIHIVAVAALVYGAYWVLWRWSNTLNPDPRHVVASVVLLVAETWAYLNMCAFVFITWRLPDRNPGPAPAGRTVDVFITCYNEPIEVLRRTAIGARAIRYPHRTYILDDGKRDEMKALCEELGIGYIRRVGNENAKAGNLNHALAVTGGEFILQLDADHVPLPNIIDRMLGHFNDPQIALVQSPQDFYNTDSFTHVVNDEGRRLWEENRIFYSLIQPGRDQWNASFFCGSCGILRRSALEAIGGFQSQTIIEDMETTIAMHRRGWKTAYHRETLAYGLSPAAAEAYHVQRLRWGQGAMQVIRKLKPLTTTGLTLQQRVCYFAGTSCYFEGWQKAVFYLMPLLYLFTGIMPIGGNQEAFLIRLVPYLILAIAAFELLSRGTGYLFISERYTMVRFWTYMMTISALFTKKPLKFHVTPKGLTGVPLKTYAPQLVLLALSIIAPIWATLAYAYGWVDYDSSGWGSLAFWMNGLWAFWNFHFAYHVVRHSLLMRQQREDHRFLERLPIAVHSIDDPEAPIMRAMTTDLNPQGLGFRATSALQEGSEVEIELPLAGQRVVTTGQIMHVKPQTTPYGETYMHGVKFGDLPIATRDAIEIHCTHHAMPLWRHRYRQNIDIVTRAREIVRNTRSQRRRLVQLPAVLRVVEADGSSTDPGALFMLEEISENGARLVGDHTLPPGTDVEYSVAGTSIRGRGIVRFSRALETSLAIQFTIGIEHHHSTKVAA